MQCQLLHEWLRIDCGSLRPVQHPRFGFAHRCSLRHIEFRSVLLGSNCVVSRIGMRTLMTMQEPTMIQLNHARMGMDERNHRLQGDESPEHQEA